MKKPQLLTPQYPLRPHRLPVEPLRRQQFNGLAQMFVVAQIH